MPFVTLFLVALNAVAYALELTGGGMSACEEFGLIPAHIRPESLLSYAFLHDPGTLVHLGCNMAFLAIFGAVVENQIGGLRTLVLYGLAAVAGGVLHVVVAPGSLEPLVGASGAVCGLIAFSVAVNPRLVGFAGAFTCVSVWQALTGSGGTVSFSCHIGGLFVGVACALAYRFVGEERPA